MSVQQKRDLKYLKNNKTIGTPIELPNSIKALTVIIKADAASSAAVVYRISRKGLAWGRIT